MTSHANKILEEIYDKNIKLNPDEVDEAVAIVNTVKSCMIHRFRNENKLFDVLFKVRKRNVYLYHSEMRYNLSAWIVHT